MFLKVVFMTVGGGDCAVTRLLECVITFLNVVFHCRRRAFSHSLQQLTKVIGVGDRINIQRVVSLLKEDNVTLTQLNHLMYRYAELKRCLFHFYGRTLYFLLILSLHSSFLSSFLPFFFLNLLSLFPFFLSFFSSLLPSAIP